MDIKKVNENNEPLDVQPLSSKLARIKEAMRKGRWPSNLDAQKLRVTYRLLAIFGKHRCCNACRRWTTEGCKTELCSGTFGVPDPKDRHLAYEVCEKFEHVKIVTFETCLNDPNLHEPNAGLGRRLIDRALKNLISCGLAGVRRATDDDMLYLYGPPAASESYPHKEKRPLVYYPKQEEGFLDVKDHVVLNETERASLIREVYNVGTQFLGSPRTMLALYDATKGTILERLPLLELAQAMDPLPRQKLHRAFSSKQRNEATIKLIIDGLSSNKQ